MGLKLGMLSPRGRCSMWDSSADGYARGEGVAVVVLKTLSRALADGDSIECIIREVKVNQDGRTMGITMPSATSQAALIRATYESCGLNPLSRNDRCQYFEAHGTGTPAGDPVEAHAVQSVFFPGDRSDGDSGSLVVGSIKTAIGHTEGTAGLAGLLKASLAVQHGIIPGNLHLNRLSSDVEPYCQHLVVPTSPISWPEHPEKTPRRASVNSFGFGGTNAHCIIESWHGHNHDARPGRGLAPQAVPCGPAVVSANSARSLKAAVSSILELVKQSDDVRLADILWTLQTRRSEYRFKASFGASNKAMLVRRLEDWLRFHATSPNIRPVAAVMSDSFGSAPPIFAVFTGQGAQWPNMGAKLFSTSHVFRRTFKLLDKALATLADPPTWSLQAELAAPADQTRIHQAAVAQPLCTAIQIALVDTLEAAGVKINKVIGHSSGEIAAAYAAGYLSASDAILVSYFRGLCVNRADAARRLGGMLAAELSLRDARALCDEPRFRGRLVVAASNSPSSVTLSGDADAVEDALNALNGERNVFARRLKVDTAYHSHHMLACAADYRKYLDRCSINVVKSESQRACVWYSSVTPGQAIDPVALVGTYWVDNLVKPVMFAEALEAAFSSDRRLFRSETMVGIEVGPHPALKKPVVDTLVPLGIDVRYSGILRRGVDDMEVLTEALGFLWEQFLPAGAVVDFEGFRRACVGEDQHQGDNGPNLCKDLPTYSWDHETSLWREPRLARDLRLRGAVHPLLGTSADLKYAKHSNEAHWRNNMRLKNIEWLRGHQFQGQVLFPAAGYISMAVDACIALADTQLVSLLELERVILQRPLILEDDTPGVEILSTIRLLEQNKHFLVAEFICSSLPINNTRAARDEAILPNFTCSVRARLSSDPVGIESTPALPFRSPHQCLLSPVDIKEFYSSVSESGLQYSGLFKAEALDRSTEGVSVVHFTRHKASRVHIHPATLDVASHGVLCTLPVSAEQADSSAVYLPSTIERVRVDINRILDVEKIQNPEHGRDNDAMIADCYLRDYGAEIRCDVEIFCAQGFQPEIQIEGLVCSRFGSSKRQEQDRILFSRTEWRQDLASGIIVDNGANGERYDTKQHIRFTELANRAAHFYLTKSRSIIESQRELRDSLPPEPEVRFWMDWAKSQALPQIDNVELGLCRMEEWSADTHETVLGWRGSYPDSPDLQTIIEIGEALPEFLRGHVVPSRLLAPNDVNASTNRTGQIGLPRATHLLATAASQVAHRYPHLNIIEIGAGTGVATASIIEHLSHASFASYTVTDNFEESLDEARMRLGTSTKLKFRMLDIRIEPVDQGFAGSSYDVIVLASDVLSEMSSLKTISRNCRQLLRPGGYLMFLSRTNRKALYTQFISAFTDEWRWQSNDDGSADAAPLSEAHWHKALLESGFSGVDSVARDLEGNDECYNYSVMLSQAIDERVSILRDPLSNSSVARETALATTSKQLPFIIIIGADSLPVSKAVRGLVDLLRPFAAEITFVDSFDDTPEIFEHETSVVCLSELNESIFHRITLPRFRRLQNIMCKATHLLWLTTGRRDEDPYSNMVVGIARSVMAESPDRPMLFVDTERRVPDQKWLATAFLRMLFLSRPDFEPGTLLWSRETEAALDSAGCEMLPRIIPNVPLNERLNARHTSKMGLVSLGSIPLSLIPARPGQKLPPEIWQQPELLSPTKSTKTATQVDAATRFSSLYPLKTSDTRTSYFASIGIERLSGRRVLVLSPNNSSHVTESLKNIWIIDQCPGQEYHSLLQDLQRFILAESILFNAKGRVWIHGADAALAEHMTTAGKRAGLELFFTASQTTSRIPGSTFIHPQSTSRRLQQVVAENIGLYVNLSVSRNDHASLDGLIRAVLDDTATTRRFPTLDEQGNLALHLEYSESYLRQAIGRYLAHLSSECLADRHGDAQVLPLAAIPGYSGPFGLFDVLDWATPEPVPARINHLDVSTLFSAKKTYFLAGLTGDVGFSLCRWMANNGARYLVLGSRSPDVHQESIAQLERRGATVKVISVDLADKASLMAAHRAIKTSGMPPVGGIANGAMVLRDKVFENMSLQEFLDALAPKVEGTRNLDQVFGCDLEFFVLFSSLSSIIGIPGLANYGAANAFMHTFAQQRRKRGLSASVLDISVLTEHGYVARSAKHDAVEMTKRHNTLPLSEADFHTMFAEAVYAGCRHLENDAQITTGIGQWRLSSTDGRQHLMPDWYNQPRLSHYLIVGHEDHPSLASDSRLQRVENTEESNIRKQLASSGDLQGALTILTAHVIRKLEHLLQMPTDFINAQTPLIKIGADSLVATQLRSWMVTELDVKLPALKILASPSVGAMCEEALAQMTDLPCKKHIPELFDGRSEFIPVAEHDARESSIPGVDTTSSTAALTPTKMHLTISELPSPIMVTESQDTLSTDENLRTLGSYDSHGHRRIVAGVKYVRTGPMSHGQDRLYLFHKYLEDKSTYNCGIIGKIHGPLDVDRLDKALARVSEKHESLRSCFFADDLDGQGRQGVMRSANFSLEHRYLVDDGLQVNGTSSHELLGKVKRHEFDVERGQVMRVLVLSASATEHEVIIIYHHLIMDGVSLVVFLQDLTRAYTGDTLGIASLQAIELSTRQRDACGPEVLQEEMRYWRTVYPEPPAPLPLFPFSKTRYRTPLNIYDSHVFESKLDVSFTKRVKSKCNQIGVTPFHFYAAAVASFLSQWLDVSDVNIGIVDANRAGVSAAHEADDSDTIGYFLNLVALRLQVDRAGLFDDLMVQIRDSSFSALANSTTPFQTVIDKLRIPRDATCHPLFQVALNYRMGHSAPRSSLGQGNFIEWNDTVVARDPFDLHVDVTEFKEGGVWVSVFLQSCLYERVDADMLAKSLVHALNHLATAEDPRMKVEDCPIASDTDIQRAIGLGRGPRMLLDPWPATLVHRFDEIAALYPNDTAIKEGGSGHDSPGRQITYSDTLRRSKEIAGCLLQHGVASGSFVGVYMAATAESLCVMLAIMRMGAVYVPLDMLNPVERLGLMVADCNPAAIVSCHVHSETATRLCEQAPGDCVVIYLDNVSGECSAHTLARLLAEPDQPACALFTSGSTGRPKGVILTHGNLINQIRVVGETMKVGREVVLQQSSLGFDPSLEQIFGGLAHGGTVIVASETARRDPVAIANIILREGVTYTVAVPSEYTSLLRYGGPVLAQCGGTWRLAVSGGEKLRARILAEFARLDLPRLQLVNAYGPTECTVSCARGVVDYRSTTEDAHMGCALPNYFFMIVDPKTLRPMPPGFPGEIFIGGEGVASGYLDRAAETEARFVSASMFPDKFRPPEARLYRTGDAGRILNGVLYSLGRIEGDSQVKLRGVRIEPDEVASGIAGSSGSAISDVALSVRNDLLVGLVVFSAHFQGDKTEFLSQLMGRLPLPTYMRPAVMVPVDGFPTTPNGKKDQRAIDALPVQIHSGQHPEHLEHGDRDGGDLGDTHDELTRLELGVKEAWEEVLPADRGIITGRHSDFFGVGGNSLLLLRLQSVLTAMFGTRLLLPKLFQSSTLSGMAGSIKAELEKRQSSANPLATMDWHSEIAALADQLAPAAEASGLNGGLAPKTKTGHGISVLLTGARGFVGTALLQLLIDDSRVSEVHCVALRPDGHGLPRRSMQVQGSAAFRSKIVEHPGDLGDRYLGMTRAEFHEMASTIDVIIHNGADVSLLKTYASLRRPNVLSCRTLLEMVLEAAPGRRVPIHFVSTASVACFAQKSRPPAAIKNQPHDMEALLASALPPISVSPFPPTPEDAVVQGYRSSKWASEALLERAVKENPSAGLSVFVHRPTSILGPGASDTDALGTIVRISTRLGAAPRLDTTVDGVLDLVDVEDVARAIVTHAIESASLGVNGLETGQTTASGHGIASKIRFVHHCSPQKMHMAHLGRYLTERLGCHIDECDQAEWLERARNEKINILIYSFLREWETRDTAKIVFPIVIS